MVKLKFSIILVIITFVAINFSSCKKENNATANNISKGNRIKYNFNPDWKFIKENPKNAQESNFNDTSWSAISCPHTFNDIDTFDDLSHGHHNGEDNQWRGTVWYRKHFQLDKSDSEKKVFIEFESVRQIADVSLHIGTGKIVKSLKDILLLK